MKRIPFLIALTCLTLSAQTPEAFFGKMDRDWPRLGDLARICQAQDSVSMIICGTYIHTFHAATNEAFMVASIDPVARKVLHMELSPKATMEDAVNDTVASEAVKLWNRQGVCIDVHWTSGYVGAVIAQYALEHPKQLNEPVQWHMFKILARAFPCEKSSPQKH